MRPYGKSNAHLMRPNAQDMRPRAHEVRTYTLLRHLLLHKKNPLFLRKRPPLSS